MAAWSRTALRKLHRWIALFIAGFIIFYSITGILLNHRKAFHYFIQKEHTIQRVPLSNTSKLREFIEFYKRQIGRNDDPKVIRIKDGDTLEFLYGSHGRITYTIHPAKGIMEIVQKSELQPWSHLNRLHKAFKTSRSWIFFSDLSSLLLLTVTLSGLLIFHYKKSDYAILALGLLTFLAMLFLA